MIYIKEKASPDERDYFHLQPIVEYLLAKGNCSANDFLWGNNRTGYFCHLRNEIDFDDLLSVFIFPDTVTLNEEAQTIDCLISYSVIKGGLGN